MTFSERIDDNSFNDLFAVKEYVHKTYTMAMQYNVGQSNINAWRENVVFIQHLIDNLGGRSHGWAMQALQSQFGGTKGLSKGKKKVADRIIRESVRHAPAAGFLQGGHGTMPPVYHAPQNFFPPPMGMAAPTVGFGGQCFVCGQMGHMSKNCQNSARMGAARPQNRAQKSSMTTKNSLGRNQEKEVDQSDGIDEMYSNGISCRFLECTCLFV